MKTPAFAAAVNRDELREGAEELGVDFDEHLAFVIAALEEQADELELTGPSRIRLVVRRMADPLKIIVLDGDETGQELLEQAIRVLAPDVPGLEVELEHHDLSLERRRATGQRVRERGGARRCARPASAIKAATITPEGKDDVGSPNRILREEVDGKVIIRTGRRIPGVVGPVAGVHYPISVVRMAVGDAYGAEQWREGEEGSVDEVAFRTERITRGDVPRGGRVRVPGGRARRRACTAGRSGPSPPSTRGCSRRRWTPRRRGIPDVDYQPVLIDATYAGLLSGRGGRAARDPGAQPRRRLPLRPRDADVRLDRGRRVDPARLRRGLRRRRGDGRGAARHRAVAAGQGPGEPDGDDPGLRGGARPGAARRATRAPSAPRARSTRATLETTAGGVKTFDLGGSATTTEFTDAVVERVRTKVEIWSSLGSSV